MYGPARRAISCRSRLRGTILCKSSEVGNLYRLARSKCYSCPATTTSLPQYHEITSDRTRQQPADELFIHERGSGDEPVILLHDLASTHKYWFLLLPHLNQQKFKYLVPDLLGHGRSPKSRYLSYDMDTHVKYIFRDILDGWTISSLGPVKRVKNPIGHGMGALIALELGSRFPDRVNRITLINLPYFDRKEDRARAFQMMGHVCYHSKLLCKLTTLPFRFNSWMWTPFIPLVTSKPTWLVRDCMKFTSAVTYASYQHVILGQGVDEAAKFLSNIGACNVTLVHGRLNSRIPVECSQRFFQRYPELSQLDIFQSAGNDLALYQAEELANLLNKEILS